MCTNISKQSFTISTIFESVQFSDSLPFPKSLTENGASSSAIAETVRMRRGSGQKVFGRKWKKIFCRYRSILNHYDVSASKAIRFGEITQNTGYHAVKCHLRSPMSVPIESLCDFLLVINTNWHPISYRFDVIADYQILDKNSHFAFLNSPLAGLVHRTLFILGWLESSC